MKNKAKIIGYTIGVIVFVSMVLGVTYAMYRKSLVTVDVEATSNNLDSYITYTKGTKLTPNGNLMPINNSNYNSNNAVSATFTFYKNNNDYNLYGHIYLEGIVSEDLTTSEVLKYKVVNNTTSSVVGEGSFNGRRAGSFLVAANMPLSTTITTYTVYIWLDEDLYINTMADSSFNLDVRCHATMKEIEEEDGELTAAKYISFLYTGASKSTATVNNITYNLAPSVGLMNDRLASSSVGANDGNIRYYGANPNNYIYFNCSDYSNQSSSTCELWRIIGVFNNRLKIIRNDSIGDYSWDTSGTSINKGYGVNEWSQADLMKLLNPDHETNRDSINPNGSGTITADQLVNNSLYYTSSSGTCYNNQNYSSTSCNFTSTGLKNDITRNMIDNATWNIGSYNNFSYIDVHYQKEINGDGKICTPNATNCSDTVERTNSWTGKVGLMSVSDYGYATDLSKCNQTLSSYNNSANNYACRSNDWLYKSSVWQWTISPRANSSFAYFVFRVDDGGRLNNGFANGAALVRPAVYLQSGVTISGGDGSQSAPYQILG